MDLPDDLLTLALTHRSYAYENGGLPDPKRFTVGPHSTGKSIY